MAGSRGLPALALIATLVAMASCGGGKDETDPDTQCSKACDAINNCSDQVGQTCKPAQYVDACKKALAAGDDAKQKEVTCVTSTACGEMAAKCFGSSDKCAGVKCTSPQLCNPDNGECQFSECMPKDMDQPCKGDEFCLKAFCVSAYPRTYRFTFRDVVAPQTDDMDHPWDTDGPPDLVAQVWVNNSIAGTSDVLENSFTSSDLNAEVKGTASFDVRVNDAGDAIKVLLLDQDDINQQQTIFDCTPNDLPNTLRFYTGMNCSKDGDPDPLAPHMVVDIDPK